MYVVLVIPISKGTRKDSLSYLSKKDFSPGSVITVPLRKKEVQALVLKTEKAEDLKSTLRSSDFTLRKVSSTISKNLFTKEFISAVMKTADYFACFPSQILSIVTNNKMPEENVEIVEKRPKEKDWSVLQESNKNRFSEYRRLIRESFSKGSSVFLCVPSMQDGERFFDYIKKGIEPYTFLLHSGISKKNVTSSWSTILKEEHPVLIIGTSSFLSVPRQDIGRIILEHESSEGYRTISSPKIDMRIFVEHLAKETKAELVFGDSLLRLSTVWRHQKGELLEATPISFRSLTSANTILFDMTEENAPLIFHEYPDTLVRGTKESNQHTFVFAGRKGLHPITTCEDCGHIVTTKNGSSPMVLYESPEGNFFYSPHTKEKRSAEETCMYCGSWRLKPLGLGLDFIEKEIKRVAPDTVIFKLDKDSVKTHKKALSIVENFYNTPGSVLIGTELALSYLYEDIDNVIITSIDSALALPDFQIQEKVLRTLLSFRSVAFKNFIIQTRNPDQKVFEYALKGNSLSMYKSELEERKKLRFPPIFTLIKITTNSKEKGEELEKFLGIKADIYPTHASKKVFNVLFRTDKWPDPILVEKIKSLPRSFIVQVSPENIL
ncbi:MAG: hypothetical protein MRY49_00510 [Candidatus Pacebacteria bacterium]|nr:hypothetical protein [Candidatus Paceibacterota bacterium]